MAQTQKAEKSKSNKMVRVLVYEGDPEWIEKMMDLRRVKGEVNYDRPTQTYNGKIMETFRGTWQQFIKKMMGEER